MRFSHLSEKIFISLDNRSITKCREVSKFWKNYLDDQRFFEIRKITTTVGQFHKVGGEWSNVFATASKVTIMDLGMSVHQFYKKGTNLTYFEGLTPIHVAFKLLGRNLKKRILRAKLH